MKLLFVNAYVHRFTYTIICAMNKNTKIILSQNLSHVIKPTRFPRVIYQGTVGLICSGLEAVVKNRKF